MIKHCRLCQKAMSRRKNKLGHYSETNLQHQRRKFCSHECVIKAKRLGTMQEIPVSDIVPFPMMARRLWTPAGGAHVEANG